MRFRGIEEVNIQSEYQILTDLAQIDAWHQDFWFVCQ